MMGTILDEEANVVDVTATLIDLAVRGHLTLTAPEKTSVWHRGDWVLTASAQVRDRTPLAATSSTCSTLCSPAATSCISTN
jgi:hypothetical protein